MSKAKATKLATEVVPAVETSVVTRTPDVIAAEIRSIDTQARQFVLNSAIEIGKRLTEAKEMVAHGEWGGWLKANVNYSQSTANNFMRIGEEYANSQALGNLSYSQAVALLSVPAEEREAFAEEVGAADKSTRDLQAAIKAKQEAEELAAAAAKREEAERKARQEVTKQYQEQREQAERLEAEKVEVEKELAAIRQELEQAKAAEDKTASAKLKTDLRKAEKKLSEAEERKAALETEMAQKLAEREAELKTKLDDELAAKQKELDEQAKQREAEASKQVEAMKAELAKNKNVEGIQVKLRLESIADNFKALLATVAKVETPEERAKYKTAALGLLEKMKSTVGEL